MNTHLCHPPPITFPITNECLIERIEQLIRLLQQDHDLIAKLEDSIFVHDTQALTEDGIRLIFNIKPVISICIRELQQLLMLFEPSCQGNLSSNPNEETFHNPPFSIHCPDSALPWTLSFKTTEDPSLKLIRNYLLYLQEEYKHIHEFLSLLPTECIETAESGGTVAALTDYKFTLRFVCLCNFQKLQEAFDPYHHPKLVFISDTLDAISASQVPPSHFKLAEPNAIRRYLCITDGFVIYCLDLKQSKDESKVYVSGLQPLPKISTLKLLEKGLPVSMGLIKWGSEAYTVSGQEFPDFKEHPDLKLPCGLYWKYGFKGTSCETRRLSLCDGGLLVSECNINFPLLGKPKVWPIVERIGDQLYVIESLPDCESFGSTPEMIPSIEVLDLNNLDRGWIELKSMHYKGKPFFITDHLVLGDLIYARLHRNSCTFVLDSKTNKWEMYERQRGELRVTRAFGLGNGRCIGQVETRSEEPPMYVVIGIGNGHYGTKPRGEDPLVVKAEAHLVSSTGYVLDSQNLPDFFEEGLSEYWFMKQATMFSVDEEENTMCVVALINDRMTMLDNLYISTFAYRIPQGWEWEEGEDFVEVVVKDRHVYQVGLDLRAEGDLYHPPPRLSACFL